MVKQGSVEITLVVLAVVVVIVVELVGIGVGGATVSSGMITDVPLPGTLFETVIVDEDRLPPIPPFVTLVEVEAGGRVKLVNGVLGSEEVVVNRASQVPPGVT